MYRRMNPSWLKHWDFEMLDIFCMEIAFFIAYGIRHRDIFPYVPMMYLRLSIMLFALDIVVLFVSNNYKNILERDKTMEFVAVIQHVTVVQLLLLLYEFVMKESEELSRTVFILSWAFAVVLCLGGRLILKKIVRKRMTRNQSRMMILVSAEHVQQSVRQLREKTWRKFMVSAIAVPNDTSGEQRIDADIPILFGVSQMMDYIHEGIIDEVYIDVFEDKAQLNAWTDMFLDMGITVHISMGFLPDNLPNQFVEKLGESYVVTTTIKSASDWKMSLKRLVDVIGALLGLLITGILSIFLAPMIKAASPGPVFFKQERAGRNGRPFIMYKFRSMHVNAEQKQQELMAQNEMQGPMFKVENDPRIIGSEKGAGKGLGNFLRKTSLDEFPQFFNVLKGDMSLVGTRPPTMEEYEKYDLHHKIRLSMKPGITGLWQVSGRSQITNFEDIVDLDTEYIENWSMILDFRILFRTLGVVIQRKGSK